MAYINFKEETQVALRQLKKRNENNIKILKEINKQKVIVNIAPDKQYSFKTITDRTINTSKTEKEENFFEICDINIVATEFIKCKFYNILFRECNFIGCSFIDCDFGGGGTAFENCSFIMDSSIKVPSLNVKDNLSCTFINCKMYCKFTGCNLSYLIIDRCSVKNTAFELSDMTCMIICNSKLKKINLVDVDLSGADIFKTYIEDFEFNDKLKSKIDEKTFIDKIQPYKNTKDEYEGLYMVYQTIANKYKENNLNNNFGEYYYLCRKAQRKTLKPIPKIASFIYWATSGYGERIIFPFIAALILIIIFAGVYLFFGMEVDSQIIGYAFYSGIPSSAKELGYHINEAVNLSVGMFGAVGVNRAMPTPETYMISNIEIILGIIMTGVGIGTLTRKLVR
jgi:uncharacterized protein YjbI with pentapeptide repeats